MENLLPYLQGLTFAGASVFVAYFLWWKTKLREELIDPAIQLLQKDIDSHSERLDKLEARQDKQENLLDEKMSKINDKLCEIQELIASQNGKMEVILEREKHNNTI